MTKRELERCLTRGRRPSQVLDNSPGRDAAHDGFLAAAGVEVVGTRTPLSFAQLQNAMRALALDRRLDFYFWGHADIVLVGPSKASEPPLRPLTFYPPPCRVHARVHSPSTSTPVQVEYTPDLFGL